MKIQRNTILNIVKSVLKDLGEDLGKDNLLDTNELTPLFGSKSNLDSMNLVNVITEIEEKLYEEHNIQITLANSSALSTSRSPFRRVGPCVDYIIELIEESHKNN